MEVVSTMYSRNLANKHVWVSLWDSPSVNFVGQQIVILFFAGIYRSRLNKEWDNNHESLLSYLEQVNKI